MLDAALLVRNSRIRATKCGVFFFLLGFMGTNKRPSAKLRKGMHPKCISCTSAQLKFLKFREYSIYK